MEISKSINSKNVKVFIVCTIFLLICLGSVYAQSNQMYLLAVSEQENGSMIGSVATVELDINPGKGRVFIDTYPLSKFDTQLSIRYAKEIACKFADVNCDSLDFMYTIRAQSQFIGGPSAGAAISALTFAELKGLDLDETTAMTGTINSGRLIGNVGGVKEKIEGAKEFGLKRVLIPFDEQIYSTEDNKSINLVEYGKNLSIEVIPVSDLEEAVFYLTGHDFRKNISTVNPNDLYVDIMKNISVELCTRSDDIISLINLSLSDLTKLNLSQSLSLNESYKESLDLLNMSRDAYKHGSYYSASSYCYGANVKLYYIYLTLMNFSDNYYFKRIRALDYASDALIENISNSNFTTITALQTAMIVTQRVEEGRDYIKDVKTFFQNKNKQNTFNKSQMEKNNSYLNLSDESNEENGEFNPLRDRNSAIYSFSLAVERLKTAGSWSKFFSMGGQNYIMDRSILLNSCNDIVADASSRLQYAKIYMPTGFTKQEEDLRSISKDNNPLDCISKASKAKAEINVIISAFGIKSENLDPLINRKLDKAAEVIDEENIAGRFPILGYSYYEYSESLKNTDKISALLYSEYALEMSNLDLYFNKPQTNSSMYVSYKKKFYFDVYEALLMFIIMIAGVMLGIMITNIHFHKFYDLNFKRKPVSQINSVSKPVIKTVTRNRIKKRK